MFIKQLISRIKGEKRRKKAEVEIEELKKAILEDPKFRDEILRELEYRTGRRDLLKVGALTLLGFTVGATRASALSNQTISQTISDYTGVKIPKPCTAVVAQDGTGDYDVSPREDASEVIQKAIDYAHSKGGGEVRIREGVYLVGNTIKLHDRCYFTGVGSGTILKAIADNVRILSLDSEDITVTNLTFDGMSRSGTTLMLRGVVRGLIYNVHVKNCKADGISIRLSNRQRSRDGVIAFCTAENCAKVSIEVAYTDRAKIIGCSVYNPNSSESFVHLYSVENSNDIIVVGNMGVGKGLGTGINVNRANNAVISDNVVINVTTGVDFAGTEDSICSRNIIRDVNDIGIRIQSMRNDVTRNIYINNNFIKNIKKFACYVNNKAHAEFKDNFIENIQDKNGRGIYIYEPLKPCNCIGNIILNSAGRGIQHNGCETINERPIIANNVINSNWYSIEVFCSAHIIANTIHNGPIVIRGNNTIFINNYAQELRLLNVINCKITQNIINIIKEIGRSDNNIIVNNFIKQITQVGGNTIVRDNIVTKD